jgi:membrane protease YdiL (CAAX protease family)
VTTHLNPLQQALAFIVLAISLATGVAAVLPAGVSEAVIILYMYTPMIAALVMMFVFSRDGYHRDGWRTIGIAKLGLRYWPFAILAPLAIGFAGLFASFLVPDVTPTLPDGLAGTLVQTLIEAVLATVGWTLGEEFGWRGYLLPRLRVLGDRKALVVGSIVWATWHMPIIFFTSLYHPDANRLAIVILFYASVLPAGALIGYLRILSGSVWPSTIAHTVHNSAWNLTGAFMIAGSPFAEEYVGGDAGIVIGLGSALALALLVWWERRKTAAAEVAPTEARRPVAA